MLDFWFFPLLPLKTTQSDFTYPVDVLISFISHPIVLLFLFLCLAFALVLYLKRGGVLARLSIGFSMLALGSAGTIMMVENLIKLNSE